MFGRYNRLFQDSQGVGWLEKAEAEAKRRSTEAGRGSDTRRKDGKVEVVLVQGRRLRVRKI